MHIKVWHLDKAYTIHALTHGMKCITCTQDKPLPEFHKNKKYCKPCHIEYNRQWRRANPKKVKASKARYHTRHRDAVNAKNAERQHNNLDDARARNTKYRTAHPARYALIKRVAEHKRRSLLKDPIDRDAWNQKLKALGGTCQACGTHQRIEIDHIKPVSKGGTNHIDNLQPLCRSCNSSKGVQTV